MEEEDWDVILEALDNYMALYNIIQGSKESFKRDKETIEKLRKYIYVGLG